ncbi:hypothetical protein QUF84_24555 [Fictibacillus enclensis]|uniref:hypothetical protein n=1 Tax=Fictibacillus enclensis TaxID=1017270 RepID=UPI0025A1FB04|nr:hypothetical protein [Fictibacillus enclensis]MDM5340370.1 hypothetical protein [Fictibacillus enclensis]
MIRNPGSKNIFVGIIALFIFILSFAAYQTDITFLGAPLRLWVSIMNSGFWLTLNIIWMMQYGKNKRDLLIAMGIITTFSVFFSIVNLYRYLN